MTAPMLSVSNVETYYGKIVALRGVDVEVNPGEIVTLIGANGAGKSTLMMTICGNPQARTGSIIYNGQDITTMPTHEIISLGIAQSPEARRILRALDRAGGNKERAARMLGISRVTLWRKLKGFGLLEQES